MQQKRCVSLMLHVALHQQMIQLKSALHSDVEDPDACEHVAKPEFRQALAVPSRQRGKRQRIFT